MTKLPELFGSEVFNDAVMRRRLPKETYEALKKTVEDGKPLDISLANVVANSMKDWAVERGATHYTHWFQPMTGVTAEKHDSFISPRPDGSVIMEFSGKALVQGEPDASSFPSGGLRATFEARGYTAWDPTSYAFIKEGILFIPTAFCSYSGHALDNKTPLLRSMKAIEVQALRVLKLFGSNAKRVYTTTGIEQEYFLVDRETYNKRKDLIYTGRTLFGAPPPKGQDMDIHYFGSIKMRISAYMRELNEELWKVGVLAKTEHNENAPAQHELAPIFMTTNVACDHNQIIMERMRRVAKKHGLTCLLHEKPFADVSGSGKHNNWSMATDEGVNLLDPGKTPEENAQFLLFFCAVIKAVDEDQELLRISVATAGNDHRLGGFEAPPAIVSVYVGEELEAILDAIDTGIHYDKKAVGNLEVGVDILPAFPRDATDRNRTSPFAFTGSRFEFRMPGSSMSVAAPNTVLNCIVAESLCQFADELEGAENFNSALNDLIRRTIREHRRVIFNGNGYDAAWVEEAERRGLVNLPSTADAVPHLMDEKNVAVFKKHGVYSEDELRSRRDIRLDAYCRTIRTEANTMLEMVNVDYIPAVIAYETVLAEAINAKRSAGSAIPYRTESMLLADIAAQNDTLHDSAAALKRLMDGAKGFGPEQNVELARYYRTKVLPEMNEVRKLVDSLELMVGKKFWPFPSTGSLLYRV
ncbi:MAG: glutamine synthetase III [Oscillospiraceae bacterium]|nr:glutamine synthetase III [Oscillospiraceae bacterium]